MTRDFPESALPPTKRLKLTPNSSFQLIRGTVLAPDAVPQRWRSAPLGAAEPRVRYSAERVSSRAVWPID